MAKVIVFGDDSFSDAPPAFDGRFDAVTGGNASIVSGTITAEMLAGADVFSWGVPSRSLTAAEADILLDWVQAGRRLIFWGEASNYHTEDVRANEALTLLGVDIRHNYSDVASETLSLTNDAFNTGVTVPQTGGYIGTLSLSGDAKSILVDANLAVVGAYDRIGLGEVFVFSDTNFRGYANTSFFDRLANFEFVSNTPPTAVNDTAAATEDGGPVVISVLANDTDPNVGDTKTLVSVDAAGTVGTVTANGDGTVTYDPGANFQSLKAGATTTTSFGYTMQDGGGLQSSATVTITITGVNDGPTAVADAVGVAEDATSANLVATLLANDADPDAGDTKAITSVNTTATLGTVIFHAGTQTLTYAADHDDFDLLGAFGGPNTATDTFTYTMVDGSGATSTATATVTITGVADGVRINGGAPSAVHQGSDGEDTIFGLAGHDSIYGLGGSDSLDGGSGNDVVDGGAGHDRLLGDSGADRMYGGAGRDTLWGEAGNDTIDGGAGDDVMSSGSGYDVYVFTAGQGGDRDIVTDFATVDRIRLEDGLTLATADNSADATGDGVRDTVLTLSDGHVIVLSGYTGWNGGDLVLG